MAPLPTEESPGGRGRRLWLWIVAGGLLVCILICLGGFYWLGYTDSGQNYQTQVAEREEERDAERTSEVEATQAAGN